MQIRVMTEKDYEQADRLMIQVHELHVKNRPDLYVPIEHPYSRRDFSTFIHDENVIALLAEEEEKVVGICILSMRAKTCMVENCTAYMDDLCVEEKSRGKGIGKALFLEAERIVKKKGAKRLDLMVWSFNETAIQFYQSLGMTPQRYIFEKEL